MTAFADEADVDWFPFKPFEVDGIHYDPAAAVTDPESFHRPPMVALKTDGECYCAGDDADFEGACSTVAYRWRDGDWVYQGGDS